MRNYTKVSTSLQDSEKYKALGRDYIAKHMYDTFLRCKQTNSTGCFTMKVGYACEDFDIDADVFRMAIERLCEVGLIEYEKTSQTLLIVKWMDHNAPTNANHAKGMLGVLEGVNPDRLYLKRLNEIIEFIGTAPMAREPSVRKMIERVSDRFRKSIEVTETVTVTVTVTETETVTETKLDLDLTRENSRMGQRAAATLTGGALALVARGDPVTQYEKLLAIEGSSASRLLGTSLMKRTG